MTIINEIDVFANQVQVDDTTGIIQVTVGDASVVGGTGYTTANFNIDFASKVTDDLTEGTNLYYTAERVDDQVANLLVAGSNITLDYNDVANTLTIAGGAGYTRTDFDADFADSSIGSLSDVWSTGWDDGDLLSWDNSNSRWEQTAPSTAIFRGLEAGTNTSLVFNGLTAKYTVAVDTTGGLDLSNNSLINLSDVSSTVPTAGRVLRANGSTWASAELEITDLGDYFLDPSLAVNDVMYWNGGTWTSIKIGDLIDNANVSTDELTEGTKLFYTDERVDDRVAALLVGGDNTTITYNDVAGSLTIDVTVPSTLTTQDEGITLSTAVDTLNFVGNGVSAADIGGVTTVTISGAGISTTDDVAEGVTNLYYTDARVDARVTKPFIDALNVDADTLDGLDSLAFATAAQGSTADTAVQPADIGVTVQGWSAVLDGTTAEFTVAKDNKLAGIEALATADQTGAEIKALYEAELNTNAFTDAEQSKLTNIEPLADVTNTANVDAAGAVMLTDTSTVGMGFVIDEDTMVSNSATQVPTQQSVKSYVDNAVVGNLTYRGAYNAGVNSPDLVGAAGVVTGDMYTVTVAGTFYTAILEPGDALIAEVDTPASEADWTIVQANLDAASIKTAYESNSNTNAFTDSEQTKLAGIEALATADQTGAEIKALYEAELNAFTDAQFTKLAGIEDGATAYDSADFTTDFGLETTTNLTEGTNLYFTNLRAQNAIDAPHINSLELTIDGGTF